MSVAFFIALDKEDINFDTFVNGKEIAKTVEKLNEFCKKNKLQTFDDFYSQSYDDLLEGIDEFELPEQENIWFSAQEGINWAMSLIDKLESQSTNFEKELVIKDIQEYIEVLTKVRKTDAKWHFEIDF